MSEVSSGSGSDGSVRQDSPSASGVAAQRAYLIHLHVSISNLCSFLAFHPFFHYVHPGLMFCMTALIPDQRFPARSGSIVQV